MDEPASIETLIEFECSEEIIELMYPAAIEFLKESKPGTPMWNFCMLYLKSYEKWYLTKKKD